MKNNPDTGTAEALGPDDLPRLFAKAKDYRWLYPAVMSIFGFDIPIRINQAVSRCVGHRVFQALAEFTQGGKYRAARGRGTRPPAWCFAALIMLHPQRSH
jgi:hypothetical protein